MYYIIYLDGKMYSQTKMFSDHYNHLIALNNAFPDLEYNECSDNSNWIYSITTTNSTDEEEEAAENIPEAPVPASAHVLNAANIKMWSSFPSPGTGDTETQEQYPRDLVDRQEYSFLFEGKRVVGRYADISPFRYMNRLSTYTFYGDESMYVLNEEDVVAGSFCKYVPPTDSQPSYQHEYVNVGFNSIRMACKTCGKDQ